MALELSRAKDLESICERIIDSFYPQLYGVDILCVLRSSKFPDRPTTIARIEKISGLKAFLWSKRDGAQDSFFLIQLVVPLWNDRTPSQQVAILDHEICHIDIDPETANLGLRDHSIEEFPEVVERHGAYHDGLVLFHHALQRGESETATREELINRLLGK